MYPILDIWDVNFNDLSQNDHGYLNYSMLCLDIYVYLRKVRGMEYRFSEEKKLCVSKDQLL